MTKALSSCLNLQTGSFVQSGWLSSILRAWAASLALGKLDCSPTGFIVQTHLYYVVSTPPAFLQNPVLRQPLFQLLPVTIKNHSLLPSYKNFIGVQLLYLAVSVSAVQQNESALRVHLFPPYGSAWWRLNICEPWNRHKKCPHKGCHEEDPGNTKFMKCFINFKVLNKCKILFECLQHWAPALVLVFESPTKAPFP